MEYQYLDRVKVLSNITGTYQNETVKEYIEEAIQYMVDAGVAEDYARGPKAVGTVARGVTDLWNYGAGEGRLSDYFKERVVQLAYKAQNSPNNPDPEEEKVSYDDLSDKPILNGIIIEGDKKSKDYGLQPEDVIITISGDAESGYTSDRTFEEIQELINAGHNVKVKDPNTRMLLELYVHNSIIVMFQKNAGLSWYNAKINRDNNVSYSSGVTTASEYGIGGIAADPKTDDDTIPARIGEDNKLYVAKSDIDVIVTVTGDEESGYTVDKTNAEIKELVDNGYKVSLKINGRQGFYELLSCSIANASFQSYTPKTMMIDQVTIMLDTVYVGQLEVTPNPTVRGGIKADYADENDIVPVKINLKNGKAYVPEYPTLESLDAQPKDFVVTISLNEDGSYTADESYENIKDAIAKGKTCYANAGDVFAPLVVNADALIAFAVLTNQKVYVWISCTESGVISVDPIEVGGNDSLMFEVIAEDNGEIKAGASYDEILIAWNNNIPMIMKFFKNGFNYSVGLVGVDSSNAFTFYYVDYISSEPFVYLRVIPDNVWKEFRSSELPS